MSVIAAIRTHRWGEDEQRLYETLRPIFGDDLAVVFHNRPANLDLNLHLKVVDIDNAWVRDNGLRQVRDWGWRCGDYFYFALRAACPGYDQYWLIEPDVLFNGDAEGFFARFAGVAADALGFEPEVAESSHPFAKSLSELPLRRAIFALTRFSGPALDHLLERRRHTRDDERRARNYPNDEIFAFSNAEAHPELQLDALEAHAPEWFDGAVLTTDPNMLVDAIRARGEDTHGKIFHPASGREAFKNAVAQRLVARSGYLKRMEESLGCLDDSDLQDIAEKAKQRFLANLRGQRKE